MSRDNGVNGLRIFAKEDEAGTLDCELHLGDKVVLEASRYFNPQLLCVQWHRDSDKTDLFVADNFTKLYGAFGEVGYEGGVAIIDAGNTNGRSRRYSSESALLRALMFSSAPLTLVATPELNFMIQSNGANPQSPADGKLIVIASTNIAPELATFIEATSRYHPPKETVRDFLNALHEGLTPLYRW